MKLFGKLLSILLLLTIIPLGVVGYLAIQDAKKIGEKAVANTQEMGKAISADSEKALNTLGEEIIKQQAELVAKRMVDYVLSHASSTSDQLQADPAFLAIVNQKVGKTGYITVSKWRETGESIFMVNPSAALVGQDIEILRGKLPQLLTISDKVAKTKISDGGYYKWQEADGTIRDKYMWIATSPDIHTADGWELTLTATTYIDEFSQPVVAMKSKINNTTSNTQLIIAGLTKTMTTQNLVILLIVLVVVILTGFVAAGSMTGPIVKLKKAADEATQGNFDIALPEVKGSDEVAELTASMEMLITAIKNRK